jgi:cation:H+ antiporter
MLTQIVAIVAGFVLLMLSADRFVHGAGAVARNLGVSPLIIGLTVVAFGTSAPEILVSAIAAWQGNPGLGVGNAIGSNIANVGLVIGITAMVLPMVVRSETMRREFPILFAIMLVVFVLLVDGTLSLVDGVVLIGGMFVMIYWLVALGLRSRKNDPLAGEFEDEVPSKMATNIAFLWLLGGLAVLLASSRLVVWSAVGIAQQIGVSDLVIGLTIVAIGTSLPELAATVMSAVKKEHDIAIGTILGSNMFNLLVVLSLPGLISPQAVDSSVITRDLPVMIVLTLALFGMSYGFGRSGSIGRWKGAALFTVFVIYQWNLYLYP